MTTTNSHIILYRRHKTPSTLQTKISVFFGYTRDSSIAPARINPLTIWGCATYVARAYSFRFLFLPQLLSERI